MSYTSTKGITFKAIIIRNKEIEVCKEIKIFLGIKCKYDLFVQQSHRIQDSQQLSIQNN